MSRTGGHLTRDRIVRQAAELFRRRSYHAAGMSEILKACAISKGAFYFYFDTKLELADAVVEHYCDKLPRALRACFERATWHEATCRLMKLMAGSADAPNPTGVPLAALGLALAHDHPVITRKVAAGMRRIGETLAAVMEERGVDPALAARRGRTCAAAITGHAMRLSVTRDAAHARLAAGHLEAILDGGAGGGARRALRRAKGSSAGVPGADEAAIIFSKIHLDTIDKWSIIGQWKSSKAAQAGTRQRLMQVVRRAGCLFWIHGYHATSLDRLLAECGVPKGSFQFYFASKRSLAQAVLEYYRLCCEGFVSRAFASGDYRRAVGLLGAAAAQCHSDPPGLACPLGNMGLELANTDKALAGKVAEVYRTLEEGIAGGLAGAGCDIAVAREHAGRAVALWLGYLTRIVVCEDAGIVEQLREDLLELAT